ncbi:MAG: hypothetical protein KAV00_13920, partial [Phycisphaerae bacterium]|nr:hypothetical protein [Phycisphaerae bacterium]
RPLLAEAMDFPPFTLSLTGYGNAGIIDLALSRNFNVSEADRRLPKCGERRDLANIAAKSRAAFLFYM